LDNVVIKSETVPIRSSEDVVSIRQKVRARSVELGLKLIDQTKIITAASELARNTLVYGGGGSMIIEIVNDNRRDGIRLTFEDHGPGIADIQLAMRDGYTTGGGLGLGLSGSKRLCNDFEIFSKVGEGARITVTRWK
jgi:serine/threonine-protein kinase RsbT